MKRITLMLTLIFFSIGLANAQNQTSVKNVDGAVITVDVNTYDFGKVKKSKEPIQHIFTLKNTGNKPLIIQRVQTGCGCAKSEYTSEPILPGKEGQITLLYDVNSIGKFNRRITIFSNASNGVITLAVKGEVIEK